MENKPTIKSYENLMIYKNTYRAMLIILKEIIPQLPKEEKFDLVDQMRRCSKCIPSLIAEGFAKRYQKRSWHKYLEDTLGEMNEIRHHINVCIDVYANYVNVNKCRELIEIYTLSAKQTSRLKDVWQNYHDNRH